MAVLEEHQGMAGNAASTSAAPVAVAGAPVTAPVGPPTSRLGALGSTPRRLRVVAGSLLALVFVAGALTVTTVVVRQSATSAARERTAPLVVDAQAVDSELSDADATSAGSFLQGRIETDTLRNEYQDDTARASAMLAAAEQDAGSSTDRATSFRTVAVDLPLYTGLVATASAAERQGSYPLAAAYLAEANNLMRGTMLPSATSVYTAESATLATDERRASQWWLAVLAGFILLLLFVSLVASQVWMAHRFRRTLNVPLVLSTLAVLLVGVWFGVSLTAQGSHVQTASTSGSTPLATYTQARILALELRADDELTLLTRDSVPSYQQDASSTVASLHRILAADGGTPSEVALSGRARTEWAAVLAEHERIRATDKSGNLPAAVDLADGSDPRDLPALSSNLDTTLAAGVMGAEQTFSGSMTASDGDLAALGWGAALVLLVAAGLVVVGFRPRIAEYR